MKEVCDTKRQVLRELSNIQSQNEEIKNKSDEILKMQSETTVILKRCFTYQSGRNAQISRFPIQDKESLEKLEKDIEENEDEIVSTP